MRTQTFHLSKRQRCGHDTLLLRQWEAVSHIHNNSRHERPADGCVLADLLPLIHDWVVALHICSVVLQNQEACWPARQSEDTGMVCVLLSVCAHGLIRRDHNTWCVAESHSFGIE